MHFMVDKNSIYTVFSLYLPELYHSDSKYTMLTTFNLSISGSTNTRDYWEIFRVNIISKAIQEQYINIESIKWPLWQFEEHHREIHPYAILGALVFAS